MAKKDFTKADGAIDKMFSRSRGETPQAKDTHITDNTQDTNNTNDTYVTNDTQHTQVNNEVKHMNNTNDTQHSQKLSKAKNKSKHFDERGKRGERFGLLLDERLKEDLTSLSRATGSKSVNDLIITVLLEFVERKESQARLEQYKKLLD